MISIETLLIYFKQVTNNPHPFFKFRAICPAHSDHHPSLIIGVSNDGKRVKLKCETGCKETDIIAKSKIPVELLIRNDPIAIYNYLNIDWEVAYRVYRFENPKRFPIYHLGRKGEWKEGIGKAERVLYNLPYLHETNKEDYIFWPEGEKDADNIRLKLGLPSTTTCGGADNWAKTGDMSILTNRKVVFTPDNDLPGKTYARQIANYLIKEVRPKEVKIIYLPDLADSGDVSNWIAKGGTKIALLAFVAAAKIFSNNVRELLDHEENTGLVLDPRNSRELMLAFLDACYQELLIYHKQVYRYHEKGVYPIADQDSDLEKRLTHFLSLSSQIDIRTKKIGTFLSNNNILNNILRELKAYVSEPKILTDPFWR